MKNKRKFWVASDHHFFHKNIIGYCDRPFKDEHEMNETLLRNHNSVVSENDLVIFLGDMSANLRSRDLGYYLRNLKGTKILIRGNHDRKSDDWYKKNGFSDVYYFMKIGEYFFSHYPLVMNKWSNQIEHAIYRKFKESGCKKLVHGHTHNRVVAPEEEIIRFNVCLEHWNYFPVDFEELTKDF